MKSDVKHYGTLTGQAVDTQGQIVSASVTVLAGRLRVFEK
jgi:hypothetical protein